MTTDQQARRRPREGGDPYAVTSQIRKDVSREDQHDTKGSMGPRLRGDDAVRVALSYAISLRLSGEEKSAICHANPPRALRPTQPSQSFFSTFQNTGVAGPSSTPVIAVRHTLGTVYWPSGI